VVSATKEVKLHAKEIYVSSASFTGSDGKVRVRACVRDVQAMDSRLFYMFSNCHSFRKCTNIYIYIT